jgi:DNA polymerase-1
LGNLIDLSGASTVICVWDGEGGSNWRRSIYKGYKEGRKPVVPNTIKTYGFTTEEVEFNRVYQGTLLRKYLDYTPVKQLTISGCEADDVIAHYINTYCDTQDIMIVSTDRDYLQLLREGVIIYRGGKNIEILNENLVVEQYGVHPRNFAIYKSLLGDKSDNIPGIYGLGEKTIIKLFPMLRESTPVYLNDIEKYCHENIDKSKLFSKILEDFLLIETNYKICQLYEPPLTSNQKHAIITELEGFNNVFEYKALLQECHLDNFKHQINLFTLWDQLKNIAESVI